MNLIDRTIQELHTRRAILDEVIAQLEQLDGVRSKNSIGGNARVRSACRYAPATGSARPALLALSGNSGSYFFQKCEDKLAGSIGAIPSHN